MEFGKLLFDLNGRYGRCVSRKREARKHVEITIANLDRIESDFMVKSVTYFKRGLNDILRKRV